MSRPRKPSRAASTGGWVRSPWTRILITPAALLVVVVVVWTLFLTGNLSGSTQVRSVTTTPGTPTPATGHSATPASGTFWACSSNISDSGVVGPSQPPPGGVRSQLCVSTYGAEGPGQSPVPLPSGGMVWRVPVGTFSPFSHCGKTVANIVNPFAGQNDTDPQSWPNYQRYLFDADWNQIPTGAC